MSNDAIEQNAGRCDICGTPIDMSVGDRLVTSEFGIQDGSDLPDGHDLTDQDAADAVADALEQVGDTGADYELARVIREEHAMCVHGDCLDETSYSMLETEVPGDG